MEIVCFPHPHAIWRVTQEALVGQVVNLRPIGNRPFASHKNSFALFEPGMNLPCNNPNNAKGPITNRPQVKQPAPHAVLQIAPWRFAVWQLGVLEIAGPERL
jgi:hypothetical protein